MRGSEKENTVKYRGIFIWIEKRRLRQKQFTTKKKLFDMIENYIRHYNNRRIQRSIGVLTPMEKNNLRLEDKNVHVGLQNVKDRLEKINGGILGIQSEPGMGTKVTIRIPLDEPKTDHRQIKTEKSRHEGPAAGDSDRVNHHDRNYR